MFNIFSYQGNKCKSNHTGSSHPSQKGYHEENACLARPWVQTPVLALPPQKSAGKDVGKEELLYYTLLVGM
jgi:hypothetical protein